MIVRDGVVRRLSLLLAGVAAGVLHGGRHAATGCARSLSRRRNPERSLARRSSSRTASPAFPGRRCPTTTGCSSTWSTTRGRCYGPTTIGRPCHRPDGEPNPPRIDARCSCRVRLHGPRPGRGRPVRAARRPASAADGRREGRPVVLRSRRSTCGRRRTVCSSRSARAGTAPSGRRRSRCANGDGRPVKGSCRSVIRGGSPCSGSSSISRWRRSARSGSKSVTARRCWRRWRSRRARGRSSGLRCRARRGRRVDGRARTASAAHVCPRGRARASQPGCARARRPSLQRLRRKRGCGSSDPPQRQRQVVRDAASGGHRARQRPQSLQHRRVLPDGRRLRGGEAGVVRHHAAARSRTAAAACHCQDRARRRNLGAVGVRGRHGHRGRQSRGGGLSGGGGREFAGRDRPVPVDAVLAPVPGVRPRDRRRRGRSGREYRDARAYPDAGPQAVAERGVGRGGGVVRAAAPPNESQPRRRSWRPGNVARVSPDKDKDGPRTTGPGQAASFTPLRWRPPLPTRARRGHGRAPGDRPRRRRRRRPSTSTPRSREAPGPVSQP